MGQGGTLNFGDSFSYALARTRDAPLLFVGDDFGTTDVVVALTGN
jgi:ribonuclease VapC